MSRRPIIGMRPLIAFASAVSLATSGAAASTQKPKTATTASGAKIFIDRIYRDYERAGKPPADALVFAPELASLIALDGEIVAKQREPNLIDYVLLCGCQDDEGLRFATAIISASASAATVHVTATYGGKPAKLTPFDLRLAKTAQGWRVADIITSGLHGGSLLARLRKGLAASTTPPPAGVPIVPNMVMPALPPTIRYQGYTGSAQYPVYNDLHLTVAGGAITGGFYMQIGIFSGEAPVTGSFSNGECTLIRKTETYRGLCDRREFAGTIYDKKGKPGKPFRFLSQDEVRRVNAGLPSQPVAVASTYRTVAPVVWSLGRARYLVERGQRCAPDLTLGTPYCFGEVIDALRRHPEKGSIDVVAMETAWARGSMIPHNNGSGWDIYKVSRSGNGFAARKENHYGTKVQLPQGCMYSGVADEAWFITVARGRKTAVEAARYLCDGWSGAPVYARYLDMGDVDAGAGDIALNLAMGQNAFQGSSPGGTSPATYPAASNQGIPADYGGVHLRDNWLAGTSASIYGEPKVDSTPATKRKRK